MMFCVANNERLFFNFTLPVAGVAAAVGLIGILYYTQVRLDNKLVMEMWVPILFFYLLVHFIGFHWNIVMRKGS